MLRKLQKAALAAGCIPVASCRGKEVLIEPDHQYVKRSTVFFNTVLRYLYQNLLLRADLC